MLDQLLGLPDRLLALTSLPNLHPALVHFPIALLLTALAFDLACLVLRRQMWLDRAATALYILGTLGAGAAFLSGDEAAEALTGLDGLAQVAIADHEQAALLTLIAFTVVSALRLLVSWLGRKDNRIHVGFFRLIALAAAIAAQAPLVVTADRGGTLVFDHAIGVQQAIPPDDELEP